MANTVDSQILVDGARTAVIKVVIISDGVSGEETDTPVVDVSALTPVPTTVTIQKIQYATAGCYATLEWDATADTPVALLAADSEGCIDAKEYGGIHSTAGAGVTGDVTITTSGLGTAGDTVYLLIEVTKD